MPLFDYKQMSKIDILIIALASIKNKSWAQARIYGPGLVKNIWARLHVVIGSPARTQEGPKPCPSNAIPIGYC